jgi:arylsulfatase A-like enzyme
MLLTAENGTKDPNGVPQLYSSNFQSVSVAQKAFGYLNTSTSAAPVFGPNLTNALDFTDSRIGTLVQRLQQAGIYQSTLLIVGAKHGQSPINPNLSKLIDPSVLQNSTSVQFAHLTADDGAYIWLTNPTIDNVAKAKADLLANPAAGISKILSGSDVYQYGFGNPALDPRVPDLIVISQIGVIYAAVTAAKNMEHGGLNPDDLSVALFVHNPLIKGQVLSTPVVTRQIAVTALEALGAPISQLDGAQIDGTAVLPGLGF